VEYAFVDRFFELPSVAVIAVTAVNALIIVGLILYFYRSIRNGISAFSVKQSFDKLKTGICFSYKNGMIKLVNRKMNELHGIITGKEMQNAKSFVETLKAGQLQPGVERLSFDGNMILRLPDMRVWSFTVRDMGTMFEITAADTTELYRVTEELNASNDELREMNERLQKYGENVDELTVARERLETKYRIHADLGKALLATRLFLQNNDGNPDEIIGIWKRNITVLGVDNSGQTEYDAINSLFTAARAVGIRVEMKGEIPKKETVKKLFLETTAEALTNAVKHADAKYFSVTFPRIFLVFPLPFPMTA
jgi:signal transduction histidine kinase